LTPISSRPECDRALSRILQATLRVESQTAARDSEIAAIQSRYAPKLAKDSLTIATLETEIQTYYTAHREELEVEGKKSVQFAHGTLGMRAPSHPSLIPLNAKWTWESITEKVRELWKKKYFAKPKEPGLDKVKIKKELTEEELKQAGMRLDTDERFYYELNRLAAPDEAAIPDEAA